MKGKSFFHCLNCLIGVAKPETQTLPGEQNAMRKYVKNAKHIAEIGVFEGYNTREFALNSSEDTVIYAIDPFIRGNLGISYLKIIALNNWRKNKVIHKIKILRGLSWDVYEEIDKLFDFIFIDGDHSFEGVKRDFDLYSQKLSLNGVIAFHDARVFENGWTSNGWGPVHLIETYIKPSGKWKIIEEVDSTVFIQRSSDVINSKNG